MDSSEAVFQKGDMRWEQGDLKKIPLLGHLHFDHQCLCGGLVDRTSQVLSLWGFPAFGLGLGGSLDSCKELGM